MKLPRDLSGAEVAKRLARHYGYRMTRSRGSHMTVTLTAGGDEHQVTVEPEDIQACLRFAHRSVVGEYTYERRQVREAS